jgi:hypothetical protein
VTTAEYHKIALGATNVMKINPNGEMNATFQPFIYFDASNP